LRKTTDTLQRQWQLLRRLPRYPQKVTASYLQSRLADDGHRTTKRSVERDLQALSEIFPITVDEREKPYGWSWQKNAPILDVPGLTSPQALAFAMVKRFLSPILPTSLIDEIGPYFKVAEQQLSALPKRRGMPSWADKVRVVHPAQTLLAPKIDAYVQAAVYEALLNDRQVNLVYHRRGADGPVEYTAHLLGVVQRGSVLYLVCTIFQYEDVRLLALHRVLSARLLDDVSKRPKDFNLDDYIAKGGIDFGTGKKIRLEALFTSEAAAHLEETPLSDDQAIRPADDDWVRVTATVNDTAQLGWWLSAFGDQVEVIKPAHLRESMAVSAAALARLYSRKPR
jgi:predicted DNA-binding transcriptional regulator YafY